MSKRTITLGKWNNKPIEWVVLKKESFGTLVISKWEIGKRVFNSNSNDNNWSSSDLRKFLNNDFFNTAFSDEEKKKIVNTFLAYPNNTKDDVFILTKEEVETLILKDGDDAYEKKYYQNCTYCYWTRTQDGSYIHHGYAQRCWCRHYTNYNSYAIRPAMYIITD